MTMKVVFFHGLEGGPHGSKYRTLVAHFPEVMAPDCTGIRDVEERVALCLAHLRALGEPAAILVGSSLGGLVAALIASRHPELVAGLVLLAPAVHLTEAEEIEEFRCIAYVLHGRDDEIVPLSKVRDFCERLKTPFHMVTMADGHRLKGSHKTIVTLTHSAIATHAK